MACKAESLDLLRSAIKEDGGLRIRVLGVRTTIGFARIRVLSHPDSLETGSRGAPAVLTKLLEKEVPTPPSPPPLPPPGPLPALAEPETSLRTLRGRYWSKVFRRRPKSSSTLPARSQRTRHRCLVACKVESLGASKEDGGHRDFCTYDCTTATENTKCKLSCVLERLHGVRTKVASGS